MLTKGAFTKIFDPDLVRDFWSEYYKQEKKMAAKQRTPNVPCVPEVGVDNRKIPRVIIRIESKTYYADGSHMEVIETFSR